MKLENIEEEEEIHEINQKRDFHVPHYTKIYGWDKVGKIQFSACLSLYTREFFYQLSYLVLL